jgi:hypothetical protein
MATTTLRALASAVFILWCATASFAASVAAIPSGGNSFVIQGDGMDGVSGIDLVFNYDSSYLSSPVVSQGNLTVGALFVHNSNNPGAIKIGIISVKPFSGSGPIALITFTKLKDSGGATSVSAKMIDSSGAPVSGQIALDNGNTSSSPGIPFSQSASSATPASGTFPSAASASVSTSSAPTYLGSVSMPSDGKQNTNESKPADTSAPTIAPPSDLPVVEISPAKRSDQAVEEKTADAKNSESRKTTVYSGVIDRFKVYKGEKSPSKMIALFKKEVAASIRQESTVALSDGTTRVKIIASLASPEGKSPNFALNGATLVSLKRGAKNSDWIIEVLPRKNTVKATMTIMDGNEDIEFPLTVAPPLNEHNVSEAGFAAYLKDANIKATDLNGGGKRDYVDDYIYAANYLVQMEDKMAGKEASVKVP